MRPISGVVLTASAVVATWAVAQTTVFDPHGSPTSGVLRTLTQPSTRGECTQCHPEHADPDAPNPNVLFAPNDNGVCFSIAGTSPCHQARPTNYPLDEQDRLPQGTPDAGYFEANGGGTRRAGVELRGRWPGERIYTDRKTIPTGEFVSPHAHDPDMPRRDAHGEGLCLNCHDPHGTPQRDLLTNAYGPIRGRGETGAPAAYAMCFRCHGQEGPSGMELASRSIADYYDSGLNGERAGHQIRRNSNIALSWPVYVQVGDKLPCYDCHGVHGSAGNDGVRPNGHLVSDQRQDWSGLQSTLTNAAEARRFCFGCHIPSDGVPGTQSVEGIVMNTIPDAAAHLSTATESCYDCHGRDYSTPTSNNVHNPGSGEGVGMGFEMEPWRR